MLMCELLLSVNQHKDDPLVIGFYEFENTTGFGTATSIWLHGLPISSANESNAGVRDDGEHCRERWDRLREPWRGDIIAETGSSNHYQRKDLLVTDVVIHDGRTPDREGSPSW